MPDPVDAKSKILRSNNPHTLKEKHSHLKLVVSNAPPFQEASAPSQPTPSKVEFSANVYDIGHNLHEMKIQDPFHNFGCDLILEIDKRKSGTAAVCHFPAILNESNKFLDLDETLYGIIAVQFQMDMLEQLFLFCANHDASKITIYMDDHQAEGFGIYQDFLIHCDETLTINGEQTEMVIPTNQEAFGKWRSFMAETNLTFEQDLWREQRFNPAIRRYLKSRAHV